MKLFTKSLIRTLWTILAVVFTVLMVVAFVGGSIAGSLYRTINDTLGLPNVITEVDPDAEIVHFRSEFEKEDGSYDDVALWKEDVKIADQIQREGTTLLWNADAKGNQGLPLASNTRVSFFSHSSVDFVYSGVGSGRAYVSKAANLRTAFQNAGLQVNDTLWNFYNSGAGSASVYQRANYTGINEVPWNLTKTNCGGSLSGTVGVFVLSRCGGENGETDFTMVTADSLTGDYFELSQNEKDTIEGMIEYKAQGTLSKVIVMLNTPMGINFDVLGQYKDDIDACVWVCQPGWEGINEIARIFAGKSDPTGHIVDTFLYDHRSTPAAVNAEFLSYTNASSSGLKNMQFQANYIIYAEQIYVGYKYFETRYEDYVMGQGNAASKAGVRNSTGDWNYNQEVAFPFGWGVGYTTFEYSNFKVTPDTANGGVNVTLTVKNTGSKPGMDAVQIYAQKPYTAHDVQYGIEQAAVNLCGYKKTGVIEPGQTEQVEIFVSNDSFKTYDDMHYKTYIREAGTYYLTAAQDAHDAVNNILAAKGYTPAGTNNRMDKAGNESLVWSEKINTLDTTTYSKSSTGYTITNQFEDVDWNKYENKTNTNVVYLSRNDWQATYPTPVSLSLNAAMVHDLDWDFEVAANPNDVMPTYGAEHVLDIVDMKGLEFDDPAWDILLDQTTLEEQIIFLGTAYHGCAPISSIKFTGETTNDGPLGVRMKYKTDAGNSALAANGYNMSFPCTPLLSASFNDELALRAGQLKGFDMLHCGAAGIYGTAPNMHRHIWGGRSYEYYAEDPFLAGIMASNEIMGIQQAGPYVNLKHFALNDQESNRHGVNIWAREQSVREFYLLAFQPAVEKAHATGIMSSFTRAGTKWCGAHYGLCTEVLRNEWGFKGFVISDCAWRTYMGVVDGLVAGNDNILYESTDLTQYRKAQTNPTVAQLIRRSTHRVLYVLANSSAMEGYAPGMKVIPVVNWWQKAILAAQIVFTIFAVISIVFMILSYLFAKKRRALLIEEGKMNEKGQHLNKEGKVVTHKVRNSVLICSGVAVLLAILFVILFVVVPMIQEIFGGENYKERPGDNTNGSQHVCRHVCDICGLCEDLECEDATCGKKCEGHLVNELPEGYKIYNFEAECAKLVATNSGCKAGNEGAQTNNPSGGQYVMNLSQSGTASLTFNITADKAEKAVLILRMGHRERTYTWDELFKLTVNGTEITGIDYVFPVQTSGSTKYFDWQDNEIAIFDLAEGENTIVLTKTTSGLNFDTLKLATVAKPVWTSEAGGTHNFGGWELVKDPTFEEGGLLGSYCATCRAYKEERIPAISESAGYKQRIVKASTEFTFGSAVWEYYFENTKYSFSTVTDPTDGETTVQRFECENMILTGNAKSNREGGSNNPSGGYYVGGFSSNDASIIFEFESDKETEAIFYMGFGCRNDRAVNFNTAFLLSLNDSKVTVASTVEFPAAASNFNYFNWETFMVVTLKLKAGTNKIVLEDNNLATSSNIDFFEFRTNAKLTAKR